MDDGTIKDRLPEWVAGTLDESERREVESALAADGDLRAEAELIQLLASSRAEVPSGLEASIRDAVLANRAGSRLRSRPGFSRWMLAAAATAVIGLGTVGIVQRMGVTPGVDAMDPFMVSLEAAPGPWASHDGRLAGDPLLGDLTDEALESLLADLGG